MNIEIRVEKRTGETYFVTLEVPFSLKGRIDREFYVNNWIDENLVDIKSWGWA